MATQTQSISQIGDYRVERAVVPGLTYIAMGPGERRVVLKRIDSDCLLGKGLHPSIVERLNRVRELAHPAVANLHGVIRDATGDFLVWEYVPGVNFDVYVAGMDCSTDQLLVLAREIILHVDSMHMQGIVHGAVNGGNIISVEGPTVRLTHVSPLLYTEISADVEAVVSLLRQAVQRRGEESSPLGQLLAEAAQRPMPLRTFGARVAVLLEGGKMLAPQESSPRRSLRRRTVIETMLVALLGVALGYGLWRAFDSGGDLRHAFRWISGPPAAK